MAKSKYIEDEEEKIEFEDILGKLSGVDKEKRKEDKKRAGIVETRGRPRKTLSTNTTKTLRDIIKDSKIYSDTKDLFLDMEELFTDQFKDNLYKSQFDLASRYPEYSVDEWMAFINESLIQTYCDRHKDTAMLLNAQANINDPTVSKKSDYMKMITDKKSANNGNFSNIVVLRIGERVNKDTKEVDVLSQSAEIEEDEQKKSSFLGQISGVSAKDYVLVENSYENKVYTCGTCKQGHVTLKKGSEYSFADCDICGATLIDYDPMEHQKHFHEDDKTIRNNIGSVGTGKTVGCCIEVIAHALDVQHGRTFLFAQTLEQVKEGVMPIIKRYLPTKFIDGNKGFSNTRVNIRVKLTNGHEIIGIASNDEQKFRSLECTAFYIEEYSKVAPSIYKQCLARLRHPKGIVNGAEKYMGILASNPDRKFVRDMVISSSRIYASNSIGDTGDMYRKKVIEPNPYLSTFLSSTRDNPYLPRNYIGILTAGLTTEEVAMMVDCNMEFNMGLVYPDVYKHIVDDFQVPSDWIYMLAHDPGHNDPAGIVLGAIDPYEHILYIVKAFEQKSLVLDDIAKEILRMIQPIPQGMLLPMVIDPDAGKREKTDGKSYKDGLLRQYGLYFVNANNALMDGIEKTRNLIALGKIKFMRDGAEPLIRAANKYRYATETEKKERNLGEKPIDKDNHTPDCLRYKVQALPYWFFEPPSGKSGITQGSPSSMFQKKIMEMERYKTDNFDSYYNIPSVTDDDLAYMNSHHDGVQGVGFSDYGYSFDEEETFY